MKVGERVRVSSHWHAFYGCRGVVTCAAPLMVLLDIYQAPIRIIPEALIVESTETAST